MIDSLTDTEVISAQLIPDYGPVLLQLHSLVVAAMDSIIIGSLPPALDPALQAIQDTLATIDGFLAFADTQFYIAATGVDILIENLLLPLPGQGPDCQSAVTQSGVRVHYGTPGADVCTGSAIPDIFYMKGGGDVAEGRGGHDNIHLGSGFDTGRGEPGPDQLYGGVGNDTMYGGFGHDKIYDGNNYTNDADSVFGGPGTDDGNIRDKDTFDTWSGGKGNDIFPDRDFVPTGEGDAAYDQVNLGPE